MLLPSYLYQAFKSSQRSTAPSMSWCCVASTPSRRLSSHVLSRVCMTRSTLHSRARDPCRGTRPAGTTSPTWWGRYRGWLVLMMLLIHAVEAVILIIFCADIVFMFCAKRAWYRQVWHWAAAGRREKRREGAKHILYEVWGFGMMSSKLPPDIGLVARWFDRTHWHSSILLKHTMTTRSPPTPRPTRSSARDPWVTRKTWTLNLSTISMHSTSLCGRCWRSFQIL